MTVCKRGHELNPDNFYIRSDNHTEEFMTYPEVIVFATFAAVFLSWIVFGW